ncbi:MAG: tetratricopeptide repeat protein [Phycisphaerales bacterium]
MNPIRLTTLCVLTAALVGCSAGHGKYTTDFKNKAEGRMLQVRAATHFDMAHQQFLAGDLDKALRTIEQSISMKDDVAKSHLLRGRILIELGRLDSASDAIETSLLINEKYAEAFYFKGIIFERFNRQDEALKSFRTAYQLDRTDPQYVIALVEILIETGDFENASLLLQQSKGEFELNPAVHQTLGHIAMMQGDSNKAVRSFNEAYLLAAGDDAILEDLARAQLAAGRFAEAEYSLSRLLAKKSNKSRRDLRHLWARSLAELDRPVEARQIIRSLLNESGGAKDINAWIELGNISWILSDDHQLREAGTRLTAIAPNRFEGHYLLGLWNMRQDKLQRSADHLIRAVELAPKDATPALMLGIVFEEMGRNADASQFFRTALRLNPDDPRALALVNKFNSRFDASSALATVPENE